MSVAVSSQGMLCKNVAVTSWANAAMDDQHHAAVTFVDASAVHTKDSGSAPRAVTEVPAKFCMLAECTRKIGFVASGRFMIFDRSSKTFVCPRIGAEVTVKCLGPTPTNYKQF